MQNNPLLRKLHSHTFFSQLVWVSKHWCSDHKGSPLTCRQQSIRFWRAAGVTDDLITPRQQATRSELRAGAVSLSGATSGCLATVSRYYEFTAGDGLGISERTRGGLRTLFAVSHCVLSPSVLTTLNIVTVRETGLRWRGPHQLHSEECGVPERWGMLFLLYSWTPSTLSLKRCQCVPLVNVSDLSVKPNTRNAPHLR